jgi:hypothetical protein
LSVSPGHGDEIFIMRKSLWIVPVLLLFAAIGAPNALADSYTVQFTCIFTCGPTPVQTGILSFVSEAVPADVELTWDGAAFSVPILEANVSIEDGWDCFETEPTLFACGFIADFSTTTGGGLAFGGGFATCTTCANVADSGSMSFTAISSSEPSAVALMLAGIGFLLVMRRRIAQELRSST